MRTAVVLTALNEYVFAAPTDVPVANVTQVEPFRYCS